MDKEFRGFTNTRTQDTWFPITREDYLRNLILFELSDSKPSSEERVLRHLRAIGDRVGAAVFDFCFVTTCFEKNKFHEMLSVNGSLKEGDDVNLPAKHRMLASVNVLQHFLRGIRKPPFLHEMGGGTPINMRDVTDLLKIIQEQTGGEVSDHDKEKFTAALGKSIDLRDFLMESFGLHYLVGPLKRYVDGLGFEPERIETLQADGNY